MVDQFSRTELIYGSEAMERLKNSRIAIFGIGGVGGYTAEALARSGIGALDLIDDDKVSITNINRQIIATLKTVGQYKVDAAKNRISEINPNCDVKTYKTFFMPDTSNLFEFSKYDYIVDAIDTVTAKLHLVIKAKESNTPIICSMGAGNKINPSAFEVTDIYKTSVCPLARVMRSELKKRGVKNLKVVYSKEQPRTTIENIEQECKDELNTIDTGSRTGSAKKRIPGSTAFVPSVVGLIIAGEIINDLTGNSIY